MRWWRCVLICGKRPSHRRCFGTRSRVSPGARRWGPWIRHAELREAPLERRRTPPPLEAEDDSRADRVTSVKYVRCGQLSRSGRSRRRLAHKAGWLLAGWQLTDRLAGQGGQARQQRRVELAGCWLAGSWQVGKLVDLVGHGSKGASSWLASRLAGSRLASGIFYESRTRRRSARKAGWLAGWRAAGWLAG